MEFSDKLNYLFELAHAEGKELATVMNIAPPQISKMRRGIRGLPKSPDSARTLAQFFARRCSSDYQRDSLSKTLRIAQIRSVDNENVLTDLLLDWLSDGLNPDEYAAKKADDFLQQFGSLFENERDSSTVSEPVKVLYDGQNSFFAYYGGEGKRLALQNFLSYLQQRRKAYTINILTDESVAWVTDDPSYSKSLYASMVRLTEQGCTFRRIAGPISDMDQAFESLTRWFPLYMTGKATSYYYKRMRDNLNRLTLFVVPDVAVLFSFSVGNLPARNGVTFFTTDTKSVNAMAEEFENYLALCDPIMNVYSTEGSSKRLHACMQDYEGYAGGCIQRSDSLSYITLPWEVATTLRASGPAAEKEALLTSFVQRYKKFKANLEQHPFVDIIRLAELNDILNDRVLIPAGRVLGGEPQYYTAAGYLQHLRNVLYLLEHHDNYTAVLRTPEDTDPTVIYVKEGYCAILTRDSFPFSIFEVSERYLVDAFTEYLRRLIPAEQSEAVYKRGVIARIRALAEEVERRLREVERSV